MAVLGSAVKVNLYDEVTYKSTTSVTAGMLVPYTECAIAAQRNNIQPNTISADRSRAIPGAGNLDITGNLTVEMSPDHIGKYLKHIIGTPVKTGSTAPYTYTFRPGALPVGMIIEKDWTGAGIASKVEQFLGCRVSSATIDVPQEGPATLQMQLQGAKYTIATAPIDASPMEPFFTGFFSSNAAVLIGGSASSIVKSVQFTINNNLDGGRYCLSNNSERSDLPEGFADVTGQITVIVDTTLFSAFIDKANARTDTSLELTLTHGAGTGASSGNEKLSIKLDHAMIELATPPITSPAGMEVTFNFTGYKSGSTDKGLVATLLTWQTSQDIV